jgi:hypothetical protein
MNCNISRYIFKPIQTRDLRKNNPVQLSTLSHLDKMTSGHSHNPSPSILHSPFSDSWAWAAVMAGAIKSVGFRFVSLWGRHLAATVLS